MAALSCPKQNTSSSSPDEIKSTKNRTELCRYLLVQPSSPPKPSRFDNSFVFLATKWLPRKINISWLLRAYLFPVVQAMITDSRFVICLTANCNSANEQFDKRMTRGFPPPTFWLIFTHYLRGNTTRRHALLCLFLGGRGLCRLTTKHIPHQRPVHTAHSEHIRHIHTEFLLGSSIPNHTRSNVPREEV